NPSISRVGTGPFSFRGCTRTMRLAGGLSMLLLAAAVMPAHAQFKVAEPFTNNTASGWTISGTNNTGNDDSGILTGGYGNITATNTNDPNGSGWLRLTTRSNNQVGGALYTGGSFTSSQGVIAEFAYVSWGGNGADGISFFLYDANS